jgi:hypothetical protein
MYYEWHNKYLNKENALFLTILNYFRQILVAFKYFVQSDWRIIVKNLELPYNVKLKKDSNRHRQSSVWILSGIRAAQSSVFCVVFCRSLFIMLSFSVWSLHILPFFDLWLPTTLLASTNFSYLLTYTRTTILSQFSNLCHCNIYVKIYWRLQLFGIMNFLMVKD